MRKLPRSLRLILLAAAVTVAAYQPATEAQSYYCWDDGTCQVCCDMISDCCTAACPWGDSFWC